MLKITSGGLWHDYGGLLLRDVEGHCAYKKTTQVSNPVPQEHRVIVHLSGHLLVTVLELVFLEQSACPGKREALTQPCSPITQSALPNRGHLCNSGRWHRPERRRERVEQIGI